MTERFLIVIVFVLTIVSTAAVTRLSAHGGDAGAGLDKDAVNKAIVEFVKNNPQAIVDAFTQGRAAQEQKESEEAAKSISTKRDELEKDASSPWAGAEKPDVTLVMFGDNNCGFCKKVIPDIQKLLAEDKKLRIVFKDFPILGERSVADAKAATAAWNIAKDKHLDFYFKLFSRSPRSDEQVLDLAKESGIDADKLKAEMAKNEVNEKLQKNLELGSSIGVRGTPAFVINGEFIRGAVDFETFKAKIAEARSRSK